jgi:hypothetical protein
MRENGVVSFGSIHDVPGEAFDFVWNKAFEPVLEVESGEAVLLHLRDASDDQIREDSGVQDVERLDLWHVNPVELSRPTSSPPTTCAPESVPT